MKIDLFIKNVIFGFVLIIIQLSLVDNIAIFGFKPDLLLIFLFYISTNYGTFFSIPGGFLLGFLQDLMFPQLLGVNALIKTLLGYVLGRVGKVFYETIALQVTGIFILQIINEILLSVLKNFEFINDFGHFLSTVFFNSLYTAILSPVIFYIIRKLKIAGDDD